jgi:hypothetical protein
VLLLYAFFTLLTSFLTELDRFLSFFVSCAYRFLYVHNFSARGLPFWHILQVVGGENGGIREAGHGSAKDYPQMAQMTQMGGDRKEGTDIRKQPTDGLTWGCGRGHAFVFPYVRHLRHLWIDAVSLARGNPQLTVAGGRVQYAR